MVSGIPLNMINESNLSINEKQYIAQSFINLIITYKLYKVDYSW